MGRGIRPSPEMLALWKARRQTPEGSAYQTSHPLWQVYVAMIKRCYYQDHQFYPKYGGRGISVSDRWMWKYGFHYFLQDMGPRPHGKRNEWAVDRRDNDGNYEPGNCFWNTLQSNLNRHKEKYKKL